MTDRAHFWSDEHFDTGWDKVNEAIWAKSASIQGRIQPVSELRTLYAIGAQQGMINLDNQTDTLPWVPDLLGRNWRERESIVIVGSAYAPFIKEYSTVGISLFDYTRCRNPREFRSIFVKEVVNVFQEYYGFVPKLGYSLYGNVATFAKFALTDLCKASFVRRMGSNCGLLDAQEPEYLRAKRKDKGGDGVVKCQPELYSKYVASASPWTWERLSAGRAVRIIALGSIAEHGLLRCFTEHVPDVSISSRSGAVWKRLCKADGNRWATHYAHDRFHLTHWLDKQDWWSVTGKWRDTNREWRNSTSQAS